MYQTKYGWFERGNWESLCQICFKQKFFPEGYQEVQASPGDFGLDGFTRTGKAFQFYCPDYNYSPVELYEKLRDKIRKDLGKLITYERQINQITGNMKIKTWYLVSPESRKKDLLPYCKKMAKEYRAKNLSNLDQNFDVLFLDIDFLAKELPMALSLIEKSLEIKGKSEITPTVLDDWREANISLVNNALRKHKLRFKAPPPNIEDSVEKLTTRTVKEYLEGDQKLRTWEELNQSRYERYQRLLDHSGKRVEEKCLFLSTKNNEIIDEIREDINSRLAREFSELDSLTIDSLSDYAISKWILDCTIDFR